jgi:hypothetical protein
MQYARTATARASSPATMVSSHTQIIRGFTRLLKDSMGSGVLYGALMKRIAAEAGVPKGPRRETTHGRRRISLHDLWGQD